MERALIGRELDELEGNIFTVKTRFGTVDIRPAYDSGGRRFEILLDRTEAKQVFPEESMRESLVSAQRSIRRYGELRGVRGKTIDEQILMESELQKIISLGELFDLDQNPYANQVRAAIQLCFTTAARYFDEEPSFIGVEEEVQPILDRCEERLTRRHPELLRLLHDSYYDDDYGED